MVNPNELLKMHEEYAPLEAEIYAAAEKILTCNDSMLMAAKNDLINSVMDLDAKFRALNAQLIRDLGTAVSRLPDNVI
jgi:hypothetical protein